MARRVSLKTVAEKSRVSVSAVSQILNHSAVNFCSDETKERVRRVAAELGYRTNFGYKLLHGQSTHTVAVLIATELIAQEEHIKNITLRLLAQFDSMGFAAYCGNMPIDPAAALEKIRELVGRGVEHIVFIQHPFGFQEIFKFLDESKVTYIEMGSATPRYVSIGAHLGAAELFRYFRSRVGDCFKLVCRQGDKNMHCSAFHGLRSIYPERSEAQLMDEFLFTMEEVDFRSGWFESCFAAGAKAMRRLLEQYPSIGGVAFMNDSFALGGADALLRSGKQPRPLLAGFNNDSAVRHYPLPISTVEFDIDRIVKTLSVYAVTDAPCTLVIEPKTWIRDEADLSSDLPQSK